MKIFQSPILYVCIGFVLLGFRVAMQYWPDENGAKILSVVIIGFTLIGSSILLLLDLIFRHLNLSVFFKVGIIYSMAILASLFIFQLYKYWSS